MKYHEKRNTDLNKLEFSIDYVFNNRLIKNCHMIYIIIYQTFNSNKKFTRHFLKICN